MPSLRRAGFGRSRSLLALRPGCSFWSPRAPESLRAPGCAAARGLGAHVLLPTPRCSLWHTGLVRLGVATGDVAKRTSPVSRLRLDAFGTTAPLTVSRLVPINGTAPAVGT